MENKQGVSTNKKRKKKKLKLWKVVLLTLIMLILMVAGAGGGIVLAFINTSPEINFDAFTNLAQTSKIFDKDGNQIESLHGVENRTFVPLTKIPKHTQDAFIAIEDERFREHFGIDPKRILGALWADIKSGSAEQGASTITQQLIKNTILTPKKELKRKIQEAYLALKLERKLSKDQILEYYLNTIFLGGNANGIQAAAEYYFNKDVDQLTIAESALIAGINQSPNVYNPYKNENTPEVYKNRQLTVLSKMLEHGFITKEEYENAKNEKLTFQKRDDHQNIKYQWFVEAAIDSVTADLKDKYGYSKDEIDQKIYSGGLRIYTTIDPKIQEITEKIVNTDSFYPKLSKDLATWGKDNTIQPQAAVVIMDYKSGEVRAVVGGRGQQPQRSQNRATDPTYARQPGSAMKPIAVYGPAIDMGYSPASAILDSRFTPEMMAKTGGWDPHNYDRKFSDKKITLREAVRRSLNVVAAKLMLEIGVNKSIDYLKKFGISTLVLSGKQNDVVPAISLGGLTKGVIPIEMAAAYGVFGNGGIYTQPILYTKVLDSEGNVILEKKPEKHQVISPQAAYIMVDMMKGVVTGGTGTNARLGSMPAAGKTGTTSDYTGVSFVGYTPYYSGAVWMGHDKPSVSIRSLESSMAAKLWGAIMKEVHKGLPVKDFEKPSGLVTASICTESGKLPTELCSQDVEGSTVVTDYFIKGTVPTETCDIHVKVKIDTSNGKLANEYCPPELVKEVVMKKDKVPTETCTNHIKPVSPPAPSNPGTNPTDPSAPGNDKPPKEQSPSDGNSTPSQPNN